MRHFSSLVFSGSDHEIQFAEDYTVNVFGIFVDSG